MEEVADAKVFTFGLSWEREALNFQILLIGVIDDQVVAITLAGEIAIDHAGRKDVLLDAALFELIKQRPDRALELLLILLVAHGSLAELPLTTEKCDFINEWIDRSQINILNHTRAPERWRRNPTHGSNGALIGQRGGGGGAGGILFGFGVVNNLLGVFSFGQTLGDFIVDDIGLA